MPPETTQPTPEKVPAEPWRSFLEEIDSLLKGSVELRCLGGFVVSQQYGIGRETSDIDFLSVIAQSPDDNVEDLAGIGTKLHRKYRLYAQRVGIVTPPAEYASRLTRMFPAAPWRVQILRRAATLSAHQTFVARQDAGTLARNGAAHSIAAKSATHTRAGHPPRTVPIKIVC